MAKIIPALSLSGIILLVSGGVSSAAPARKKAAAKHAAKRAAPQAGSLASLVRAWRDTPTPARRAAVESYAAAHPKDAALARLAIGIVASEQKDYTTAIAALKKVQAKLPQIADYTAYYLAAARVESRDFSGVAHGLLAAHSGASPSPLSGRAWLVEARALKETAGADAVRILRDHYAELPQPDGDAALAECYQAARDLPHAADFYQRVFYQYPTTDAATRAAAALSALKDAMGASYPPPLPQQMLRRADRLMEIRAYALARVEYQTLLDQVTGLERDQARVRIGAADYLFGSTAAAYPYLRALELAPSEADAERLYYLLECARRLTDDDEMMSALNRLAGQYAKSPWRLKALVSAASRFLLVNRPDAYLPLYKAAYEDFPREPIAGLCHWKVTFQAYLRGGDDAGDLLREHLRNYSAHATGGAALYFLGRQAEQANDFGAARACYQRLAGIYENHYYAMLARERLQQAAVAGAASSPETGQFLAGLTFPVPKPVPQQILPATELRIARSRLLRTAGLSDLADAELRFGSHNGAQPPLLAMESADAADAPHQAMHIMKAMAPEYLNLPLKEAPRKFWELLFPLPYRDDLVRTARDRDLDPYLLAGLIRQESEFNPQALSHANAYGLTQVRPGTGRQYARQAGVARFTNRLLFQPVPNLKIGTSVLRSMLNQNGGRLEETLAAYNAGPNRVAEWLTWNRYREPAEFVESIPFSETRDYVQAVLRNADIYRRLYK
ncbi:MAG: lytic transglycosylase domain-containing protein [Acidobacteriia bacterium]|nr:lytic transglycosylase domain-containing protein [Terriglobia bacterium]